MFSPSVSRIAVILLFLAVSCPLTFSQDDEAVKKTQIQDDLDFAVDLARHRYFDLANDFVEKIQKKSISKDEKVTLLLTNAQILKLASDYSTKDSERKEFYSQAVAKYLEFVTEHPNHADITTAQVEMAEVYQNQGRFLTQSMRTEKDEEALATLRKDAEQAFRECVQLLNTVSSTMKELNDVHLSAGNVEKAEDCLVKGRDADYKKGMAYYFWALIYPEKDFNREDKLTSCVETLDDYIWDASDNEYFNTLWAYLYQARCYNQMGEYSDALDLVMQIIDKDTGVDLHQATTVAPEYARLITDLCESAYLLIVRIHFNMEKYDKVIEVADKLVSDFKAENLTFSEVGDAVLLVQAEACVELGDPDNTARASSICKEVSDRNPTNIVGRDAKLLLNKIINLGESGGNVPPDVLMAAGDGLKSQRKYFEAIQTYHKVVAACKTVQQKEQYLMKAWQAIGVCYRYQTRFLEAAAAFKKAYQSGNRSKDEATFKVCAMSWFDALLKRHKATRDRFDDDRKRRAREVIVGMGISTDFQFIIAKEKFIKAIGLEAGQEKDDLLNEAYEDFKSTEGTSKNYEHAMVYQARCFYEMGKYAEAIKKFNFFDTYMKSVKPPKNKAARVERTKAQADGAHWRVETHLKLKEYKKVLEVLTGFEDKYPTQAGFFAAVIYNRIMAHLGLEDFDSAEKLYKEIVKKHPDSNRCPLAAYYIARAFIDKRETLKPKEGEEASKAYIDTLKKCIEYMGVYCEVSNYDSFLNFNNVCDWTKELGELEFKKDRKNTQNLVAAKEKYEKLKQVFKKDKDSQAKIEKDVNRSYAEVLNQLQEFHTAKPIWLRLLAKNKKNVGILRGTAFCMGGWVELEGKRCVEISGTGDYAPKMDKNRDTTKISLKTSYDIWNYLLKGIEDRGNKYSYEWWEAKFNTAYNLYRAGEKDPAYTSFAKKLITNQKLFKPDLGGTDWSRRFNHVERQLKRR